MIPYAYTYLFGAGIFMIPWVIFYILRKDLRREMIEMSIFCAVMGIVTSYLWWTVDWWKPDTITGTRFGIEDMLLGFANGGVAAVLYQVVHNKHSGKKCGSQRLRLIILIIALICIISFLFLYFRWTSFNSSVFASMFFIMWIFFLRRDLIKGALLSGIYMVAISLPVYIACELVSPGWIQHSWVMKNLSGILFIGIPIEDIVFYFLSGFVFSTFYKLWYGFKTN